jgi:hypothetical protein
MTLHLDRFLPLPEAARKLGLTETRLRAMIEKGKIRAGILPTGEIVVSENGSPENLNDQLAAIQRQEFEHLRGKRISVTESEERYGITGELLNSWIRKSYVLVIERGKRGRGSRMYLDEADVAYCARIHTLRQQAGVYAGVPLLDENGLPYLLKHPELSNARRQAKQRAGA